MNHLLSYEIFRSKFAFSTTDGTFFINVIHGAVARVSFDARYLCKLHVYMKAIFAQIFANLMADEFSQLKLKRNSQLTRTHLKFQKMKKKKTSNKKKKTKK